MKRRPPLDAGGRPTTTHELQLACGIVDRSGVVPVLAPHMDAEVGRHRTISLRGLLVSCQLNALARHHRAHLIGVARVINALTDDQRAQLGIVNHDPRCSYDRVERSFVKLAGILAAGDQRWLVRQPTRPRRCPRGDAHLQLGGRRRHRRRDLGRPARRGHDRDPGRRGGRDPAG